MNIAVINIKDIIKLAVKFGLLILLFIITLFAFKNIKINVIIKKEKEGKKEMKHKMFISFFFLISFLDFAFFNFTF